jgi:hypothetical protein
LIFFRVVADQQEEIAMSSQSPQQARRRFLAAAGIGSAGAAVAVVASGVKPAQEAVDAPVAVEERRGYHVTEHIQKYYKTTLV